MSAPRTRRRWLELLRRTAGVEAAPERPALDEAELWSARDRAAQSAHDASKWAERVVAAQGRQRTLADASAERAKLFSGRLEASSGALARLRLVLDAVSVLALNVGLEGARAEGAHGKSLSLVADEVRAQATRGAAAMRDVEHELAELGRGASEVAESAERLQRDAVEAAAEATQLRASAQSTVEALGELETRLRAATGLDPEAAKLVSRAGEHARGLAAALSALESSASRDVMRSLLPVLGPVARLLDEAGVGEAPGGGGEG